MRKSSGFVGGLGGQMTLTLEDKCEAKVNYDLAKIEFDLLIIRETSTVLIPGWTKPLSKVALSTKNSWADNEQEKFVGK